MGTFGEYYLNGVDLATSTGVFMNENLTTCAPVGYYSQGNVVRYLDNTCTLLPRQDCPSCATPCSTSDIESRAGLALCLVPIEVGTSTGAVKVTFDPNAVPDGIRVIYNSATFNKFSAPLDGYHGSTVVNGLTYMGDTAQVGTLISASPHSLAEYELYDGTFSANGDTAIVAVTAGSVSTSAGSPGACVTYIPKISTSITTLLVEVAEALVETDPTWTLNVECPAVIAGWSSSKVGAIGGCSATMDETIYIGKVSGSVNAPVVNDWAFVDENAVNTKALGPYTIQSPSLATYEIIVDTNGIITSVTTCP